VKVLNVGSGTSTSLLELVDLIGEAAGQKPEVRAEPGRPIDVPVTQLDSSAITQLAGWRPEIELADGVAECLEWAKRPLAAR
jgi:UDP-glucose 4-epimerase